eukprot:SAG22_NODE_1690_length_3806_cov_1.980577_1_plen_90_part_00
MRGRHANLADKKRQAAASTARAAGLSGVRGWRRGRPAAAPRQTRRPANRPPAKGRFTGRRRASRVCDSLNRKSLWTYTYVMYGVCIRPY